jgi:hypothetical protein
LSNTLIFRTIFAKRKKSDFTFVSGGPPPPNFGALCGRSARSPLKPALKETKYKEERTKEKRRRKIYENEETAKE